MSKSLRFFGFIVVFIALTVANGSTLADTILSTTFTYQGYLSLGGNAVTAVSCDLEFGLFSTNIGGTVLGTGAIERTVSVNAGVFTTQLDFGLSVFDGQDRYLEIGVLCPSNGGNGPYTLLSPRSPITPTPYSVHAVNANELLALRVQYKPASPNLIGGFSGNAVDPLAIGVTIGGGGLSGSLNQITDNFGTIGGGQGNTVGDTDGNPLNVRWATISGGVNNTASGPAAFVGGGEENSAVGLYSVVPGGFQNTAAAAYSFAVGSGAQALHTGAFVWSDSTGATSSTAANQFMLRASGGMIVYTAAGTTTGALLPAGDSNWAQLSDRNAKDNFETVDSLNVLEQIAAMPITTWNYLAQGEDVRHIGPMAQDFYAAFGLGVDDKHISTIDADGVALAAIQGLYQVVQDKEAEIASLQAENETLKTRLDDLDQRLAMLEAIASPSQAGLSLPVMLAALLAMAGAAWIGRSFMHQDVT